VDGPSLDAEALPANQRGRLTPRQAVNVVLKEVGKGWVLMLSPGSFFLPALIVLVPVSVALTPVFLVAAGLECLLKLRVQEGAINRVIKQRLFYREYEIVLGQTIWGVPRRVHDGLVDGSVYRLYLTRLSNVLVNYEKLEVTEFAP
jgi:hypothetical protein